MVCLIETHSTGSMLIMRIGVDACNTVLEVLLFAAAMNLGQGWNTVLALFGGKPQVYLSLFSFPG